MFNSAVLETVIGVVFILVLFSTVCAAIRESIEGLLKTRASYLEYGIRELLNDRKAQGLVQDLYHHPLVAGLFAGSYIVPKSEARSWFSRGRNLPSYIPARNFAAAVLDIVARGPVTTAPPDSGQPDQPDKQAGSRRATQPATIDLDVIRSAALKIQNEPMGRVVLNAIDLSEGDINRVLAHVGAWFDSGMDRVSGWYKRLSSRIIFGIALVLAVLLNVDVIHVSRELYGSEAQRAMLVAYAQNASSDPGVIEDRQKAFGQLNNASFPIGWQADSAADAMAAVTFSKILGWIFTAFAATLGAPFWFDVLNKVMVIRATVKPHEKSREESSQDG